MKPFYFLQTMIYMLGEIKAFAGNYAPKGWLYCKGQVLNITEHPQLFSVLGTTYGGDGTNTFALPDLQGRVMAGVTEASQVGDKYGKTSQLLSVKNLPSHSHQGTVGEFSASLTGSVTAKMMVSSDDGDDITPSDNYLAGDANGGGLYTPSGNESELNENAIVVDSSKLSVSVNTPEVEIGATGSNTPFAVYQPTLSINYIISIEGEFPKYE